MRIGLASAVTILLIGCLALTTQCRPEAQMRSYRGGRDTNLSAPMVNSTGGDESKIVVQFCVNKACRSIVHGEDWPYCYCCEAMEGEPCFKDREDCRAECPICDPKCPQPPSRPELKS